MCSVHRSTQNNCQNCCNSVIEFQDDYRDCFPTALTKYVLVVSYSIIKKYVEEDGIHMVQKEIISKFYFIDDYDEVNSIISRDLRFNFRLYELVGSYKRGKLIGYLRTKPNLWDVYYIDSWEGLLKNYKIEQIGKEDNPPQMLVNN